MSLRFIKRISESHEFVLSVLNLGASDRAQVEKWEGQHEQFARQITTRVTSLPEYLSSANELRTD